MEIMSGYKQTEVGVIPIDWEVVQLTTVAKLESGHTPSRRRPQYWGGNVPWVSLHDTESLNAKEIFSTAQNVTQEGINNSSARLLPEGTVIFSRTATVGKTTVLGREMATSQDFANYICGPLIYNHFLVYLFRHMAPEWKKLMAGSIHNTVYMPVFRVIKIPLPPRNEQESITNALSDVDSLLAKLDQLIAKKRDIKQATMQQLLTGRTRLPGFSGKWEIKLLGELFDVLAGGDFNASCSSLLQDERHPYPIYSNSISDAGLYGFCSYGVYPSGSITVTARGTLGISNYRDHRYTAIGRVLVLQPKQELDGRFFSEFINNRISFVVESTGVPQLTAPQISKYELLIPHYAEQIAIANILSDMDAEIEALEARRNKTHALKQGMMQELLTGRIRLV